MQRNEPSSVQDLAVVARDIIDSNRYMTLATADGDGRPWAAPVWYAHEGYSDFLWVSRPEARHSRNLTSRPGLAIVIFDSTVPVGGRAGGLPRGRGRGAQRGRARARDRDLLAQVRGPRSRPMARRGRRRAGRASPLPREGIAALRPPSQRPTDLGPRQPRSRDRRPWNRGVKQVIGPMATRVGQANRGDQARRGFEPRWAW